MGWVGSCLIGKVRSYIPFDHFYIFSFFLACLLYAVIGSPTPDVLSFSEFLIGGLLFLSIGAHRCLYFLLIAQDRPFWMEVGRIFLIYGLFVTTMVAVFRGSPIGSILRDLIPFLFLFLPLLYDRAVHGKPEIFLIVVLCCIFIGVVFSLRSLMMRFPDLCFMGCTGELLYLENMPTVLFSALILNAYSFLIFFKSKITIRIVLVFIALMLISLVPLSAMILSIQRASIGAWCTYVFLMMAICFFQKPIRFLVCGFFVWVLLLGLGFSIDDIYYVFSEKNALVGLNMRPQEFAAIWDVLSADWGVFLFGIGWGGHFYNPAVGGLSVNFTHNFFTSILLKSGFCGLMLASLYIVALLCKLGQLIQKNFVLGMAIFMPILIDLVLYASFKSLDFGLMLLMITTALIYFRRGESLDAKSDIFIRDRDEKDTNAQTKHLVHE